MYGCGEPSNGILLRGVCAVTFSGPINIPQEAMYWTTKVDGTGQKLSGEYDYLLHFPAGGLPPNNTFWSLTMGDAKNHFVSNPVNRYVSAIVPVSRKIQMDPSIFISRILLRQP